MTKIYVCTYYFAFIRGHEVSSVIFEDIDSNKFILSNIGTIVLTFFSHTRGDRIHYEL